MLANRAPCAQPRQPVLSDRLGVMVGALSSLADFFLRFRSGAVAAGRKRDGGGRRGAQAIVFSVAHRVGAPLAELISRGHQLAVNRQREEYWPTLGRRAEPHPYGSSAPWPRYSKRDTEVPQVDNRGPQHMDSPT